MQRKQTINYNNRLISSDGLFQRAGEYGYDHSGGRISYETGTWRWSYPNGYYNAMNSETLDDYTTKHIFANGESVATVEIKNETLSVFYAHGDHLNSSSVMTDDNGELEQTIDYYPFGNLRFNERRAPLESFDEQRKFTGHEYDDESRLTYMGARYYLGDAGKFLSEDPVFGAVDSEMSPML